MLPMVCIVGVPMSAVAEDGGASTSTFGVLDGLVLLVAAGSLWWFWRSDLIRPGSFSRRQPADKPPMSAGAMLFGLMIAVFVVSAVGVILAVGGEAEPENIAEAGRRDLFGAIAGTSAAIGAIILAHRLWPIDRFRFSTKGIGTGVLVFALVFPITLGATALVRVLMVGLGRDPGASVAHEKLRLMLDADPGAWLAVIIAVAALGTPIFEEIIFRGLFQSAMVAVFPGRWPGVLVSTAFFTWLHVGAADPISLTSIALLGLALGLAYEWTGKLLVPITMHAAFNLLNIVLAFALLRGS
ncbi:MAG TPA: CPBP family intramembrane metalloprotease [Phycisphaerales bacterium]|nr:CPBP family intramembrane metalloprotease [Phycisphaerales bacterium]